MDLWVPLGLGLFKVAVLGAAIFFSIKSHREGERELKRKKEASEQQAAIDQANNAAGSDVKADR